MVCLGVWVRRLTLIAIVVGGTACRAEAPPSADRCPNPLEFHSYHDERRLCARLDNALAHGGDGPVLRVAAKRAHCSVPEGNLALGRGPRCDRYHLSTRILYFPAGSL